MKSELVHSLTETFEGHAQQTENGVEYWLARDLQKLLGYTEWRNFLKVIAKAETACEVSGQQTGDHFVDVNKMVDLGSGSQREVEDVMLTRYACYLSAQNGDSRGNYAISQRSPKSWEIGALYKKDWFHQSVKMGNLMKIYLLLFINSLLFTGR